ncbi:hypothetical protein [Streptomyces sp. 891-h]|uniref:hypothetical protein n=1 Tax=Streptomyces sp. 891-h TaxID=2720714 RepID=UPI001FAA91E0|nr:hypothetical protein [Streptomyces sp. 891-h]UNZ16253.1 hypothetical protein HC362_03325 [Streptomyces sp. 891-h]
MRAEEPGSRAHFPGTPRHENADRADRRTAPVVTGRPQFRQGPVLRFRPTPGA